MFLEEWDEEKYRDLLRREAEEDGYAAGEAAGMKQGLEQGAENQRKAFLLRAAELVRGGSVKLEEAARLFGFDAKEISANL